MTTVAQPAPERASLNRPLVPEFHLWMPAALRRVPDWARVTGFISILFVISLYFRTRALGGQLWIDEGIATGIASHSLSGIPGILRMDGSPPLYYLALHIWMSWFGDTEKATHTMSLIFGMATIPLGYWAGTIIGNRRTALMSATLFATNAFITQYSEETRMYSLMVLLGLLATIGLIQGFVYRRRGYVAIFAVAQALMFYTHIWGTFFALGSLVTLAIIWRIADDEQTRKHFIRDVLIAFIGAGIMFVPWIPNFLYQVIHTGAPWAPKPGFGAPVLISEYVLGGDSITIVLVVAAVFGFVALWKQSGPRSRQVQLMWLLLAVAFFTLLFAWVASQISPAWVVRYFAPIVPAILLALALGIARAGVLGAVAIVVAFTTILHPGEYAAPVKDDMAYISYEMGPKLHKGDLVIVGQPEATPLAYYYLPAGLRFANTLGGEVKDPTFMDWVNAMDRYRDENPRRLLMPLLNSLKPGQQVLFLNPLSDGTAEWSQPWTSMIRRRSAQWAAIIEADKQLKFEAWAPHNYQVAPDVNFAAWLFKKVS